MRIYTVFSALSILASCFWFSFTIIAQTTELNERRITKIEERVEQRGDRLATIETNIAVLTAHHRQVEKHLDELETLLKTIGAMVGAMAVNALAGLVRMFVRARFPGLELPK